MRVFVIVVIAMAPLALVRTVRADHNTTTLVSTGAVGGKKAEGAFFEGASTDGIRVFLTTEEQLVSADTDTSTDVYERSGEETTLVSTGPVGGNGAFDSTFEGASTDGIRLFLTTKEQLVSADTDTSTDVYERSGSETTLVSTGPDVTGTGPGPIDSAFGGASTDGTRVFFSTRERLAHVDSDASTDVYERSGGETTLVSTGPNGGTGPFDSAFEAASTDGTRVFFSTQERLVSADTDTRSDIYERSAGETTRVSAGAIQGNSPFGAFLRATSTDGTRVFFSTEESLAVADTDTRSDIYERSGGETTLVSTGHVGFNRNFGAFFEGIVADGTRVFFATREPLVAADTDSSRDVYERSSGSTTLVSAGPADLNRASGAGFRGASVDGARVFFTTREPLVSSDIDEHRDVYERSGGATTLVSTGPAGGNGDFGASFEGTSADGTRMFFETNETLVGRDTDAAKDVYMAEVGTGSSVTVSSRVGLRFKRHRFSGRVRAASDEPGAAPKCVNRRQVQVKKARPGKDPVVATDRTNRQGSWSSDSRSVANGRYYAVVAQAARDLDGLRVICQADRSRTIRI